MANRKVILHIVNTVVGILASMGGIALIDLMLDGGSFWDVFVKPESWIISVAVSAAVNLAFSRKKPGKIPDEKEGSDHDGRFYSKGEAEQKG